MTFHNLVRKRYSVRGYSEKEVSRELIDRCIEAARLAPSACNSQPWYFHICDNSEKKSRITMAMNSGFYGKKINQFIGQAPVIIAIETKKRARVAPWLAGLVRKVKYELIDVGIAAEHLALQATEFGLGTCWIGWFNEKAVKRELALPGDSHIDVMMTLGWPLKNAPYNKSRKSIDDIRRYI